LCERMRRAETEKYDKKLRKNMNTACFSTTEYC
jgi:hypothetical protein